MMMGLFSNLVIMSNCDERRMSIWLILQKFVMGANKGNVNNCGENTCHR
jgi:hypothetical protein